MRSASAALAGLSLALAACEPIDDAAVRAPPGAEAAQQPAANTEPGREAGDAAAPEPAAEPEIGRTFVFDCDGDVSFTVRFGPGEMALWAPKSLGGAYQVLSIARSGSGARYVEGDTVFWNKGDLATIEIAGQRFVDCRSTPSKVPWADAKRRGATFRALGNEPSWYVEIFADRLVIVTELGTKRTELEHGGGVVEAGRTTYRAVADGSEATVVIDRRACADSMSGEGFEAAATVSFEYRTLLGCGRFL
jgi:putative lipoprotein